MALRTVEVEGLRKRFGSLWALDGLNLEVEEGEIVGLVGTNGSGKTTTLRLLAGLTRPTAGSIRLLRGTVASALPRVGVVMEEPAFYTNIGPLDHVDMALAYAGYRLTRSQQVDLLASLGITMLRRPARHLSLGMRRRLALAVALAKRPAILLLDEPANGLDLDGMDLLRNLLRDQARAGVACILSSHNWDEVERLVDRVVVLHRGKVRYNGTKRELQSSHSGSGQTLEEAYRALTKGVSP